jgi:hypothetical protein
MKPDADVAWNAGDARCPATKGRIPIPAGVEWRGCSPRRARRRIATGPHGRCDHRRSRARGYRLACAGRAADVRRPSRISTAAVSGRSACPCPRVCGRGGPQGFWCQVTVPEGKQNILGIATIDAPVDKVFQAFTDRELFARLWCRGNPLRVHHFDNRDRGAWHVAGRSEGGHDGGSPSLPKDCCL